MKATIVTTTINISALLPKYAQNARYYGHSAVDFVVIGDRKSPPHTADSANRWKLTTLAPTWTFPLSRGTWALSGALAPSPVRLDSAAQHRRFNGRGKRRRCGHHH
ncbi:MAG: hypothetical protein DMG57_32935 [Acidobacteria bacterium]|nr:MAG: hypothetical protein DMG57_32935 [Acidobacteriota bacterium]